RIFVLILRQRQQQFAVILAAGEGVLGELGWCGSVICRFLLRLALVSESCYLFAVTADDGKLRLAVRAAFDYAGVAWSAFLNLLHLNLIGPDIVGNLLLGYGSLLLSQAIRQTQP